MKMKYLLSVAILLHLCIQGFGAPRSKPKTHYDEKQTGDYNIRLSLKDFQIIALLGEDSLGDIGNLDYSYDYTELTTKGPSGVIKPSSTTTTTTTTPFPKPEKPKPSEKPEPEKLENSTSTILPPPLLSESPIVISTEQITTLKSTPESGASVQTLQSTSQSPVENIPDRIPVFVQIPKQESSTRNVYSQPSVSIVVTETEDSVGTQKNQPVELSQQKKCPSGLIKDKKGRCRRLRRPQFPFELARIASNIAAKLTPALPSKEQIHADDTDFDDK